MQYPSSKCYLELQWLLRLIVAGYIGATIVGFGREVSQAIGFIMNGTRMVELVIASIGFAAGVEDMILPLIAVAIGLVIIILSPITLRTRVSSAKSKSGHAVLIKDCRKVAIRNGLTAIPLLFQRICHSSTSISRK